jgi:hypothetical protein
MWRRILGVFMAPRPYSVDQIDVGSIRLNDVVPVDTTAGPWILRLFTIRWLIATFRFADLIPVLPVGHHVPVVATGNIGSDRFVGRDWVNVKQGRVHCPREHEVLTPGQPYLVRYDVTPDAGLGQVELLSSFDGGRTWNVELSDQPNTGEIVWPVPQVAAESVVVAVMEVETAASSDSLFSLPGLSGTFSIRPALAADEPPAALAFAPPEPSPSWGRVTLRVSLPRRGDLKVQILDVQGRRMTTLASGVHEAGWHRLEWNGETDDGVRTGPGLYFALLRAEGRLVSQRIVRLR